MCGVKGGLVSLVRISVRGLWVWLGGGFGWGCNLGVV